MNFTVPIFFFISIFSKKTHMGKVTIRVYDLSKGQAKLMSQALLGFQLDGIWHSTIEIHGKEIFFAQEVTYTLPGRTHYGDPVYTHEYGISEKTIDELENKLKELKIKFNQSTYNLLLNNCNHFADDLCFFLVKKNLPAYIMSAHESVMKTPLGPLFSQNGMNFNPGAKRDDL